MKVYITSPIPEIGIITLKKAGLEIFVNDKEAATQADLMQAVLDYDAVLTSVLDKIDEKIIKAASPKLKVIANFAVGWDNIDIMAAQRRGISVTNTPGVAAESVAEHTFALILGCFKQLIAADRYVRGGNFKGWRANLFLSHQVWGKTIGIVGLGRIGAYVGHIAYGGFKMKILYHDVCRVEDFELLTEAKPASLGKILKEADIVTLHVPLTDATRHLIGREELGMMKKEAILINTARGAIVDQEALVSALREKKIAAAGLDVYEDEHDIPHALRVLGNVILTPHSASATYETREAMAKIAAQNIIDVFEGREPIGLVKVS